ncbi:TnsA endonuclease N-terminal domain-containing protein [Endozoicomonas sp. ALD040]|uniref:TnsA endonuclease N-terminal domain-containing protein n=1 Tax=Endozoicomonas sp. ALD040 TaxID=3403079 RepID=UPI003BAF6EB8
MKPRKITKSRVKQIYSFYSHKTGEKFLVESGLEYDACFNFEYDPEIEGFEPQPLGFRYKEFGRVSFYTPDFLLYYASAKRKKYVEIKIKKDTEDSVFQDLFECKKSRANELGFDLEYMTEETIRREPFLSNLKLLDYYHSKNPLDDVDYHILEKMERCKEARIIDILDILAQDETTFLPKIYNLVAKKMLSINISNSNLNVQSLISPINK